MIKFNKLLDNLYQRINENAKYAYSTLNDYEKFKKYFIETINTATVHYGELSIHTWCEDGGLIPEEVVEQLMKDDQVYSHIQREFLRRPFVGGITNFTVFNNLKPYDQDIYKAVRAHTLATQVYINFDEDLDFTLVDDFLCKTDPQFAKDCGEKVYDRYKLYHIKNILNKDEEDDISNW